MPAPQPTAAYRFGPFEADLKTGELRKHGIKLKLQELPFRLLVSLLERPGEVVAREELQAKLWPDGTFVDFERGLGTALNKVREALGDSAATPRFIETLPRRGYRFIAPVQKEVQKSEVQETAGEEAGPPRPDAEPPQPRPPWNHPRAALIAGVVVIVLAGGAAYARFRTALKPLTDQDVLVLADFTNTTGDSAFDGALRQALAFELEQSPFLKIMDDEEVNQTLQLMGRSSGQPITNDIAHEVCVREGEKATIGGLIASLGKTYLIALQANNCQTGKTLAREQAEAEDKEHVIKAVAKATTVMRAKLGESLGSIQKPDRQSAFEVTTNSLEALQAFQLGWELLAQGSTASTREAIGQFQRAIEFDPNFASAYEFLQIAYRNSGQPIRANGALTNAFALAGRVSDRERLYVSGQYYLHVTGEMDRAIAAYQMVARAYPRFAPPHIGLYIAYGSSGQHEKALEEAQEAVRLAPRTVPAISNLMTAYRALDRFEEAKAVARKAISQKLDGPTVHRELLFIADIQNDDAAREREIQWLSGKPDEYWWSLGAESWIAAIHGQRRAAKDLIQRAVAMAHRQGLTDFPVSFPPTLIDGLMGDCAAALRERANASLAVCGDPTGQRLAAEQLAKYPPPNPDAANLVYRRGLGWLRQGNGAEAAAEFQKILDHRGRNWLPQYSLAFVGMARASALVGDTAKARRDYEDFFAIWKEADPDVPILIQARKEYAALPIGHRVP
jgi:eukaryotic-like serine/threonine-protein kinase